MAAPTDRVSIRRAKAEDAPLLETLIRGERVNPFGIDWRNFVVAESHGAPVGCAQLRPAGPGAGELGSLVVQPGLRRLGLAARLVDAVLAEAGDRRMFVVTAAIHAPWYARWGFRPVAPLAAPWPVRRNWLLGQAGSVVALAQAMRPRRLAVLERPAA